MLSVCRLLNVCVVWGMDVLVLGPLEVGAPLELPVALLLLLLPLTAESIEPVT